MALPELITSIHADIVSFYGQGKVASYIPGLEKVDPKQFGIALCPLDDEEILYGDAQTPFSIQSVSKVITLTLAYKHLSKAIWQRVGKEPSGNPFNSLIQLEHEKGIPRNPFINAGALVICDILLSAFENPKKEVLDFVKSLSGNADINFDSEIAASEHKTGFTNKALVSYMKSHNNIENDIDDVLDLYYHCCSITMTAKDLAHTFSFLANGGINPINEERVVTKSEAKRINAVMLTCGFYDESGEFAYRVGLPGKSGVSGSIVAVSPGKWSIAVWSPELNQFGNSVLGIEFLDRFTSLTENSIF